MSLKSGDIVYLKDKKGKSISDFHQIRIKDQNLLLPNISGSSVPLVIKKVGLSVDDKITDNNNINLIVYDGPHKDKYFGYKRINGKIYPCLRDKGSVVGIDWILSSGRDDPDKVSKQINPSKGLILSINEPQFKPYLKDGLDLTSVNNDWVIGKAEDINDNGFTFTPVPGSGLLGANNSNVLQTLSESNITPSSLLPGVRKNNIAYVIGFIIAILAILLLFWLATQRK